MKPNLSVSLKCCPFQTINICPGVTVNNPQAEVPGVPVLQILEGVGGNDDPENIIIVVLISHKKKSLGSVIKGRELISGYWENDN